MVENIYTLKDFFIGFELEFVDPSPRRLTQKRIEEELFFYGNESKWLKSAYIGSMPKKYDPRFKAFMLNNDWSIVSRKGGHRTEIETPPLTGDKALWILHSIFQWMQRYDIETNSSTGIHINMSFKSKRFNACINPVILSLTCNDVFWLKQFQRSKNCYAQSITLFLKRLLYGLVKKEKIDVDNYDDDDVYYLSELLQDEFELPEKCYSINTSVLPCYVEFRHAGNRDYQNRFSDVLKLIEDYYGAMIDSIDPRNEKIIREWIRFQLDQKSIRS